MWKFARRGLLLGALLIAMTAIGFDAAVPGSLGRQQMAASEQAGDAYQFEFTSLEGGKLPLSAWRGKPILVVNTASFCGFTPQYTDLEALWRQYRDHGVIVLGVPSNDFGQQEPGTAGEIKQFCSTNFDVDFPLTEKYKVTGGGAHPFYKWVVTNLGEAGAPRWNFHKYLIDGKGQLVGTWPSQVKPTDQAITGEIEAALAAK